MSETLDQALSRVWETNWRHKRSGYTLKSQASAAILDLRDHVAAPWSSPAPSITHAHVRALTAKWYSEGLAPATIQKRLSCLATLGVNVEGCKVHVPNQLKWHLTEQDKEKLLAYCRGLEKHHWSTVADFIEWTTLTGLRIEETLRLNWGHCFNSQSVVYVPGTKTGASQAALPLGERAHAILASRWAAEPTLTAAKDPVFNLSYTDLLESWGYLRERYGWQDDPTATLKALRRSAARYLHVDCGMPLHMVQQYLRHSNMATTLGYLKLTGGYGTEEMRRYLK